MVLAYYTNEAQRTDTKKATDIYNINAIIDDIALDTTMNNGMVELPLIIQHILLETYKDFAFISSPILKDKSDDLGCFLKKIYSGDKMINFYDMATIIDYTYRFAKAYKIDKKLNVDLNTQKILSYYEIYFSHYNNRQSEDAVRAEHFILNHFMSTNESIEIRTMTQFLAA